MQSDQFAMLRDATCAVADRHTVESPGAIDADLRKRTAQALSDLGLDGMRTADEDGASVQECVALVEELGARLLCGPYLGPLFLGAEVLRLLGAEGTNGAGEALPRTIALAPGLGFGGLGSATEGLLAWDAGDADTALVVAEDGGVFEVPVGDDVPTNDLLRPVRAVRVGTDPVALGVLTPEQLAGWRAFGLTMVAGEMVGCSRRIVELAVEYAQLRTQYGRAIGGFQAIAHLLADAHVAVESAVSATRYAAWCCDTGDAATALRAARVAKASTAQAASEAVQSAMQVFGGMAQTWEHVAHLHLRRVLADGIALATTDELLEELVDDSTERDTSSA